MRIDSYSNDYNLFDFDYKSIRLLYSMALIVTPLSVEELLLLVIVAQQKTSKDECFSQGPFLKEYTIRRSSECSEEVAPRAYTYARGLRIQSCNNVRLLHSHSLSDLTYVVEKTRLK